MIPQGRKGSPTNRTIQAQVVRAGARSAGMGERNIHHVDCIHVNANVLAGGTAPENTPEHTSLNLYRHDEGDRDGWHNRPGISRRHRMVITPDNIPSFFS